jgi:hypothetical protein
MVALAPGVVGAELVHGRSGLDTPLGSSRRVYVVQRGHVAAALLRCQSATG